MNDVGNRYRTGHRLSHRTGYDDMPRPETDMAREPELRISLRARREEDRLRIDFTFANLAHTSVYVYSLVASPVMEPLPHRAYTAYADADQSLHLLLGEAPGPNGLSVYAKVIPFASYLRPGESHADYIEVTVPVPEWQPYADPWKADEVEIVQTRRVSLLTDYWWERTSLRAAPIAKYPGYFKAQGTSLVRESASVELSEPIPVLRRRDEYERF
jgi:hypothetical protein